MRRAFRLPGSERRLERELDDEVRFHVEMRAKALEAAGLSREDAWTEALAKFGDVGDLRQYCLSMEVAQMRRARFHERLANVAQDLRVAVRQYRKSPGFAVVAALTLALGVGATTAIFSVVNGVILKPLSFDHPGQIVQLWGIDSKGHQLHFADPTFDRLVADNHTLSAVAEFSEFDMSLSNHDEAIRVRASVVSKQFFDVLRAKLAIGRFFAPEEERQGVPMAIVISHRLWTEQFGASPSAIGATIHSGASPVTIVGVLRAGQEFPADVDVWFPRELFGEDASYTAHNFQVVARTNSGVSVASANADVSRVLRSIHADVGDRTWTFDGVAVPLLDQIVGDMRGLLLLVLGASAILLLIACANVANLLIARMAARENEIAVRLAIGAGRGRLAQQFLTEASLLAGAGCLGGVVIAWAGMRLLLALRPALIPRIGELALDWRVLAFAALVSAATATVLGLLAAWRAARGDLRDALSQSQRTQSGGGTSYRIRGSLVVAQLAMTVVLLVAAGLLARSFVQLMTIDPGYRTRGVVVANLMFGAATSKRGVDIADRARYFDQLADRAHAIPGLTEIGISDAPPFSGGSSNGTYIMLPSNAPITFKDLEPFWNDKERTGQANYRMASPGYFAALNIPLLRGRMFAETDGRGAPHVALVSSTLATRQWPNESAIGKVIEFGNIDGDSTPLTIVGIVGDTREEDLASPPEPTVYVSYRQRTGNAPDTYVIMSTATEASTITAARRIFPDVRSNVPMRFETIESILARSVANQRFMLLLVGVFGTVALLLATLGVYSVISYLVTQRGRELSIRVALGASTLEIVRLVLGQGVTLSLLGLSLGAVSALVVDRLLEHLLYHVSTADPIAFAAVLVALGAVALVASYLPARRAARLAPMDILRGG